jgi:glycosyltransferase involved in cell wall biosynthesis
MWLFDKSIYKSKEYMTLVNAFDTRTYSFDNVNRVDFRKKYGIASEFTFGTIGRFCYQKNPELTIEILKELKEKELNYKFIWIGNGPDYNLIKDKAKEYDLLNNIVFIESTKDIPKFLSAIDLFILPSRYEGLCLVLIEAQSSGLDIIAFDNCSREVDITHKIEYLSINDKNKWVDSIEKKIRDYSNYCDHIEAIRKYPEKDIMNSMFDYNLLKINLNTIYENLLKGDE